MLLLLFHRNTPRPKPSGGVPAPGFEVIKSLSRPKSSRSIREEREALGILPRTAEAIAEVAAQQAEMLRLDELQRESHLREEFRLRGLEYEARYLALANAERERLIDREIALLLRRKLREEADVLALIALAASCA